ncbi:hypothetical protein Tco_1400557 [Tanacetum coccineum]
MKAKKFNLDWKFDTDEKRIVIDEVRSLSEETTQLTIFVKLTRSKSDKCSGEDSMSQDKPGPPLPGRHITTAGSANTKEVPARRLPR